MVLVVDREDWMGRSMLGSPVGWHVETDHWQVCVMDLWICRQCEFRGEAGGKERAVAGRQVRVYAQIMDYV